MLEHNYIMSFGAIPSQKDVRDYQGVATTSSFPQEWELKMVRVKNQGSVGSCVAHALSSTIEYFNSIQNDDTTEMSVGYIYGNRTGSLYKKEGMIIRDAISNVCKYGDVSHSDFPYHREVPEAINKFEELKDSLYERGYPNRFTSYYKLKNIDDIKASLMNNGPVIMSMKWYKDITVKSGVLTTNKGKYNGNHCMVIYGWNDKGWKILNSWGIFWGNGGKAILPYDVPLNEAWGIVDTYTTKSSVDLDIKKPFNSTFGKIIAKVLNIILNILKKK